MDPPAVSRLRKPSARSCARPSFAARCNRSSSWTSRRAGLVPVMSERAPALRQARWDGGGINRSLASVLEKEGGAHDLDTQACSMPERQMDSALAGAEVSAMASVWPIQDAQHPAAAQVRSAGRLTNDMRLNACTDPWSQACLWPSKVSSRLTALS